MSVDVTIMIPKPGQPREFTRYSQHEIRNAWRTPGHFSFTDLAIGKDNKFVVFFTNDVTEAIIVAGLFVRELMTFPECTWYDFGTGALLLYYGSAGPVPNDDSMALAMTMDLIERIMSEKDIKDIKRDAWGEHLFWPYI